MGGAQVLGVVRLEDENESGYRLGDVFQATAWDSYRFADWISTSVRGLYTEQSEIEGHYNGGHSHSSPPDSSSTMAAASGTSASASTPWCPAVRSRGCG